MCHEAKNFKALKENLLLLNKRRAQLKAAIKAMVKRCMEILDTLQYDQKMDLLNTLITVTEGKVRPSALSTRVPHLLEALLSPFRYLSRL